MREPTVTRSVTATAGVALAVLWLARIGNGALAPPPLSIDGLRDWLFARDATTAAFALLRLLALGFGGYLLVVLALGGFARCLGLGAVASIVDRFTLPFVRGMVGGMALLGVMSPPPLQPQSHDSMVELPSDPSTPPMTSTTVEADTALLRDTSAPADERATLHLQPSTPVTPVTPSLANDSRIPEDSWVVQHGDSFWSIASEHLTDTTGGLANEREIATYWTRLIDANRDLLVNPSDPNLLFAGQIIALPAVAPG